MLGGAFSTADVEALLLTLLAELSFEVALLDDRQCARQSDVSRKDSGPGQSNHGASGGSVWLH